MTGGGQHSRQGTVLLTGATGYLGKKVLARLAASGRKVRCLLLPGDAEDPGRRIPCEVVKGDLTDLKGLENILDGVDTILHAAALMPPSDPDRMKEVNVGGRLPFWTSPAARGSGASSIFRPFPRSTRSRTLTGGPRPRRRRSSPARGSTSRSSASR